LYNSDLSPHTITQVHVYEKSLEQKSVNWPMIKEENLSLELKMAQK